MGLGSRLQYNQEVRSFLTELVREIVDQDPACCESDKLLRLALN